MGPRLIKLLLSVVFISIFFGVALTAEAVGIKRMITSAVRYYVEDDNQKAVACRDLCKDLIEHHCWGVRLPDLVSRHSADHWLQHSNVTEEAPWSCMNPVCKVWRHFSLSYFILATWTSLFEPSTSSIKLICESVSRKRKIVANT